MKNKKESKAAAEKAAPEAGESTGVIANAADLKKFLLNVRDKMTEDQAAPIYVMSALNTVLSMPQIYEILDNENKEVARDIWLRLKKAGLQLRNPPLLFGPEEDGALAKAG